jgi:gas vesicle protein
MFNMKQTSYKNILEGLIIGGSLAAVTTYVLGTRKGKKFQKEFLAKVEEIRRQVKKSAHKAAPGKSKRTKRAAAKKAVRAVRRKVIRRRRVARG